MREKKKLSIDKIRRKKINDKEKKNSFSECRAICQL
jgi:hypothetical protein